MAESSTPVRPRPVSGIPVPINKRQSLSFSTSLNQSTSSNGYTPGSRAASPITLSAPPAGRNSPLGMMRRQSLMNASNSRKTSFTESGSSVQTDDPGHLKAQIAMLQTSLAASHQRIMALTSDMNLDSSTSSSPRPATPTNGFGHLPSTDGMTPMSEVGPIEEGEGEGEGDAEVDVEGSTANPVTSPLLLKPGKSMIPRLPHSNSSYDLRSSAATPAKSPTGIPRKPSAGPLGLDRIPQSAVAQALVLHTSTPNGSPSVVKHSTNTRSTSSPTPSPDQNHLRSPFLGPESPYSPSFQSDGRLSPIPRKVSGGSAASTRVIDGLQTDLINAKGHNEKLKQELRSNQRLIGSLTRQNEDLKETKERMRVECEGLNNVIARKERLLQEVLERARTAESALVDHQSTRKALEQSTKKSLQQMTTQVSDAHAAQHKAEREANSLRDSVKSLRDVWQRELKGVKEDMNRAVETGRTDMDKARATHTDLLKVVQSQAAERKTIQTLAEESMAHAAKANAMFDEQIADLKAQLRKSEESTTEARSIAIELAAELAHLRRLMREPRRASLDDAAMTPGER